MLRGPLVILSAVAWASCKGPHLFQFLSYLVGGWEQVGKWPGLSLSAGCSLQDQEQHVADCTALSSSAGPRWDVGREVCTPRFGDPYGSALKRRADTESQSAQHCPQWDELLRVFMACGSQMSISLQLLLPTL